MICNLKKNQNLYKFLHGSNAQINLQVGGILPDRKFKISVNSGYINSVSGTVIGGFMNAFRNCVAHNNYEILQNNKDTELHFYFAHRNNYRGKCRIQLETLKRLIVLIA